MCSALHAAAQLDLRISSESHPTATAEARSLDDCVSRSHIVNLSVSAGPNKTANYVYLSNNKRQGGKWTKTVQQQSLPFGIDIGRSSLWLSLFGADMGVSRRG
ncbi:hypothetical protein NXS19_012277 [Fusarium pseudograminearum]|nr:hypothetical protein NXS19_012277 [Fusarium pseudograminearum]